MVKSQKITEFFIVLSCCVVLSLLLKMALQSGSVIWMLPLLAVVGVVLSFRFWLILPPLIFGTSWYLGGSVFLKNIPYPYFLIIAALGVSVINQCMKHNPKLRVTRVSLATKISVLMISLVVAIYVIVTFSKYKGWLNYGEPGGLKFGFQYVLVLLFIIWNFSGKIPTNFFNKIPAIAFGVAIFKMLVDLVNFIYPKSVYITYYFTTDLSFEVKAVLTGGTESALRIIGFREFGLYGLLYIISRYCTQRKSDKPRPISYAFLMLVGLFGVFILLSGFRGFLIRYAACFLLFLGIYNRRLLLISILSGVGVWGGLVVLGETISFFPLPIQRVLGALPGVYKTEVAYYAYTGIEWRADLRRRFFTTEFWHHPWFGRGQSGDLAEEMINIHSYTDMLYFEISQMWHSGWVSTLDLVGIVGCVCLILLQLITLFASWRLIIRYQNQLEGWMLWAVFFFLSNIIIFWYTGFFQNNFPTIALSAVLVLMAYDKVTDSSEANTNKEGS